MDDRKKEEKRSCDTSKNFTYKEKHTVESKNEKKVVPFRASQSFTNH